MHFTIGIFELVKSGENNIEEEVVFLIGQLNSLATFFENHRKHNFALKSVLRALDVLFLYVVSETGKYIS